MTCNGCGNTSAYKVRTHTGYDGQTFEECDQCSRTVIRGADSYAAQRERITEKATKGMSSRTHTFVPPLNETTVGGVFRND